MIFASLGLDWANFRSGINGAMASTRQLNSAMGQGMAGGVASGIMQAAGNLSAIDIALKIATFSIRGFYNAVEAGGELVNLSTATGVAVDKLMELQIAFDLSGTKAEQVQPVLAKMQRAIAEAGSGSVEAANKFAMLGLEIDSLQGMTADQQFMAIGQAIAKIPNPAQQAAMAMGMFEESGVKLLSLFKAGGMAEAQKALGGQAQLMLENAGVFKRASDVLGLTGSKVRGFFVGITSQVMPQLLGQLDEMANMDLSKLGQSLGDGIAIAIELLDRTLFKFLKMSEEVGKTQKVYGGQAFMGMGGGIGMGGGTALSEAAKQTEQEQPKTSYFDTILQDIEKKRAAAREKYATPEAGPTGLDFIQKAGQMTAPSIIATSGAKVGALGSTAWSSDGAINVQRDQLATQKRIADSIDSFLRQAGGMTANPYLGDVTPQLGVI